MRNYTHITTGGDYASIPKLFLSLFRLLTFENKVCENVIILKQDTVQLKAYD